MLKDQRELLSVFNEHNVEYVVVGGHAVSAYGYSRLTKDIDIPIRGTSINAERVFEALAAFGAPISTYEAADLYDYPTDVIQFGVPPGRIAILQSIAGAGDDEIWSTITTMQIDDEISVPFISLANLLRNKQAAGRLRDLADVDESKKVHNH